MNAPPPPPIETAAADPESSNRCPETRLAVPECSCESCLTRLMRTHAPSLLEAPDPA